ncbi:ABC transporter ATP-binding protein [Natronobacterium gregoryi]|uniref:ABC-type D-xylose/L-arabinose transporter n=2 Tax=Natronobacterium gregoryi TaxID=44930 RepID=L0ANG1_NATGS|nr:sn-glycerol-3-phosphate ABC transporter ATP-binding protein UgpC [Natronobacterium gregoryi]AFZ74737.1 ATPase component of ABC-type sugar transporter [Natronobacterium gregoryi SP2]ELY73455.1 carbohydrate ABC transporter ATP-binding protein, cut1 family [Natronobacterium gregoryi SP2]PLK20979.1 sn-glycerol-3-phosphate ABC transporter ATP-binding protein UgpC [Natronobacterium gregoryi SP2]SFJ03694.1 carbohydrate ABC transporter ATP-binding protein, CUT1 family [Natronobacterium gregoryi]
MADLQLDSVTKVFVENDGNEITAVEDVSLEIEDGEFLVLVGPSGCGKSTTLRMVAGLETVTDGEIRLDETVVNERKPKDRDIAMVFQSYALYPHMTVRENMSFGLEESTEMPDDEISETVESASEMLDIDALLDRKPDELSGGQQQRVALGRAIVRDPEVFLLDEPLSNLDAKLRAQMRTELQRLQEKLDVATIYVTHDQTEAMTMADKIAILNDGQLQQVGTPLECYHEPANLFVAGFIGEPSMNFFDASRDGDRLVHEQFEYELSDETAAEIGDHDEVVLGVRPEDIEVRSDCEAAHSYETVVDVVEPMGDENNVYLAFDSEREETFVATIDGFQHVEREQSIVARLPEEAIHVFDRESGRALRNRTLDTQTMAEPPM